MAGSIDAASVNRQLLQHLGKMTPGNVAKADAGGPVKDVARAAQGAVKNTSLEQKTDDSFGRSTAPVESMPSEAATPAKGQGRLQGGRLVVDGQAVGGDQSLDARRAGAQTRTTKGTTGPMNAEESKLSQGMRSQLSDLLFKGKVSKGPLGESDLRALAGKFNAQKNSPGDFGRAFQTRFNTARVQADGDVSKIQQSMIGR